MFVNCLVFFFYFFFFQAEDGIRDLYVTGVQTCALPICPETLMDDSRRVVDYSYLIALPQSSTRAPSSKWQGGPHFRSEERRVGKECRSRWSADHYKKKKEKSEEVKGESLS